MAKKRVSSNSIRTRRTSFQSDNKSKPAALSGRGAAVGASRRMVLRNGPFVNLIVRGSNEADRRVPPLSYAETRGRLTSTPLAQNQPKNRLCSGNTGALVAAPSKPTTPLAPAREAICKGPLPRPTSSGRSIHPLFPRRTPHICLSEGADTEDHCMEFSPAETGASVRC